MSHWAKPGVKCVYIVKRPPEKKPTRIPLQYLGVYTIRAVIAHPITGELGVYLVGVENEIHKESGMEKGYYLRAFRPLITRSQEQDMELFTPLLDVRNHDELEQERV